MGRKAWRAKDVLVIQHILSFGKNYIYVGGAQFDTDTCQEIKKIAKQEGAMFLKWEPLIALETRDKRQETRDMPIAAGFRKAFKAVQPQQTIVIDLTKSEEELLGGIYPVRDRAPGAPANSNGMHPKTRYNIGLAERHGVTVRALANPHEQEMGAFVKILQDTARRDGFHGHPAFYYHKLAALPFCELFVAEHGGHMAAAALILFFEGTATYLHGASDYALRNLMAPHILHWEIMREAKKRGCTQYDLWGIDERTWSGVTRFKRSFGGEEILYVGSWDLAIQPIWYFLYRAWHARNV